MYHMKRIVHCDEDVPLPKCMYFIRNLNGPSNDKIDQLDICNQVKKFLKTPNKNMAELEHRQQKLMEKLDALYERIKSISAYCSTNTNKVENKSRLPLFNLDEVVLVANADNLPYYMTKLLKDVSPINISWHIHSSVSNEKVPNIHSFVKSLPISNTPSAINLRLIFKGGSAQNELKLASLSMPLVGTVNILRFLSVAYPDSIPYDNTDFNIDSLLDTSFLLEHSTEKNKGGLFKQLFSNSNGWIYNNKFSIVDLAAYNVVKQSRGNEKYVPKQWLDLCNKTCSL